MALPPDHVYCYVSLPVSVGLGHGPTTRSRLLLRVSACFSWTRSWPYHPITSTATCLCLFQLDSVMALPPDHVYCYVSLPVSVGLGHGPTTRSRLLLRVSACFCWTRSWPYHPTTSTATCFCLFQSDSVMALPPDQVYCYVSLPVSVGHGHGPTTRSSLLLRVSASHCNLRCLGPLGSSQMTDVTLQYSTQLALWVHILHLGTCVVVTSCVYVTLRRAVDGCCCVSCSSIDETVSVTLDSSLVLSTDAEALHLNMT